LAHGLLRRYSAEVPSPVRALLAALALVALSPPARADPPKDDARAGSQGSHARRLRHPRRAKLDDASGRASRDGSGGHEAPQGKAAAASRPARHAPAEKPESIGCPNDGHLKGGAHVDLSRPYFRLVPAYESGDVRWGLPVLVNMIDRAARAVHKRFPGSVLDVGDVSQRGGGDLLRHHSHESGRDADLGFYAVDARGKQVHARTFIKFDPSMASPTVPGARYDFARNWAFVEQLLTDPTVRVSHIFIAEWIRHELLAYARPRASHGVWERAAMVMMQPHNSLPHDDHIHVRISCPRDGHSSCIELARNAPHGGARVAHRGHGAGHGLKTPAHAPPRPPRSPAAVAPAPVDPLTLPTSPAAPEVEPDDMLDDGAKITD
jgi:penicillin-insensitive murein DD-endopeptidase